MKILLVCAGGFSTTMMMESMKKVVKESKSLDEKDYPMEAIGVDKLERYINDYDVILVGPQLSHKYDFIQIRSCFGSVLCGKFQIIRNPLSHFVQRRTHGIR